MFLEASFLKAKYARTHTFKMLASSVILKQWIWAVQSSLLPVCILTELTPTLAL